HGSLPRGSCVRRDREEYAAIAAAAGSRGNRDPRRITRRGPWACAVVGARVRGDRDRIRATSGGETLAARAQRVRAGRRRPALQRDAVAGEALVRYGYRRTVVAIHEGGEHHQAIGTNLDAAAMEVHVIHRVRRGSVKDHIVIRIEQRWSELLRET